MQFPSTLRIYVKHATLPARGFCSAPEFSALPAPRPRGLFPCPSSPGSSRRRFFPSLSAPAPPAGSAFSACPARRALPSLPAPRRGLCLLCLPGDGTSGDYDRAPMRPLLGRQAAPQPRGSLRAAPARVCAGEPRDGANAGAHGSDDSLEAARRHRARRSQRLGGAFRHPLGRGREDDGGRARSPGNLRLARKLAPKGERENELLFILAAQSILAPYAPI